LPSVVAEARLSSSRVNEASGGAEKMEHKSITALNSKRAARGTDRSALWLGSLCTITILSHY
jgi:hypothetical protein